MLLCVVLTAWPHVGPSCQWLSVVSVRRWPQPAAHRLERRANVPTGTWSGSSTLALESIGPSHPLIIDHDSKETLKPFEHTDLGSAAPRPTPSQSNLLLGTNTLHPPTGGSSTRWSHISVASASLFREGNRHGWVPVQTRGRQRCHRQKFSKPRGVCQPITAISPPKKSREGSVPS